MNKVFSELALDLLQINGIEIKKASKLIIGEDNFIIPALTDKGIYYFKFFINPCIDWMHSEIKVVDYLREHGISVPEYYSLNGQKVFTSKEDDPHNIAFYASKHMDGTSDPDISEKLFEEIINEVAYMHKVIVSMNRVELKFESVTDYQRVVDFYFHNYQFCSDNDVLKSIEKVISCRDEQSEKYPIHADLYFNNLLFKNNHFSSFIDFSDMRESYLEDDLGKFFQNLLCIQDVPFKKVDELIGVYESVIGRNISRRNVYISIFYRVLYRGYYQSKVDNEKLSPKAKKNT